MKRILLSLVLIGVLTSMVPFLLYGMGIEVPKALLQAAGLGMPVFVVLLTWMALRLAAEADGGKRGGGD